MRRTFQLLSLVAVAFLTTAGVSAEAERKEYLMLTVRADSGCAQRFTVESTGFQLFASRGRKLAGASQAGDTISVFGNGTVKLVSADSARPLSVDVWIWSGYRSEPVRYTGSTIKVDRASNAARYMVTTP